MRTISGISTAALLVWMLVGLSSGAQEPVASENTTASDNASVNGAEYAAVPAEARGTSRAIMVVRPLPIESLP